MFDNLSNSFSFMSGDMKASKFGAVSDIVLAAANVFIFIAFGLSFIAVAYSFILFTISSGDKVAMEKAQKSLLWGGIGMFVSLLALGIKFALVNLFSAGGMF